MDIGWVIIRVRIYVSLHLEKFSKKGKEIKDLGHLESWILPLRIVTYSSDFLFTLNIPEYND